MEYLYVCHFSNGHIKVGRSIDPTARIAQHADRVACMGVELVEHAIFECIGASEPREAFLIGQCASRCEKRHQNEWFVGLDYGVIVEMARQAASMSVDPREGRWPRIIAELKATGLTQNDICVICDIPRNNISRLATGYTTDPSYSDGERIMNLYRDRCGEKARA